MAIQRSKFAILTVLAGLMSLISWILILGSFHASERIEILESFSVTGAVVPSDYVRRVDWIVERIQSEDYWLGYAPWNRLMTLRFLVSSISSLAQAYPDDSTFRTNALEYLSEFYELIDSDTIRSSFSESGTIVPFGIIYQSWRLQVLEELAKLEPGYRKEFFFKCDEIAHFLKESPRFTAESYPGWGWYVDNADAYHALWAADIMLVEQWEPGRYGPLIASWTWELATHIGESGLPLAEAYRPWNLDSENQVRWSATGWLLWILHDIDPNLAENFFHMYKREFLDSFGRYSLVRDIPRNERKINNIFDGPKLWPYSSSATILAVPIFSVFDVGACVNLLRSFDTLLVAPGYNSNNPDWLFWGSVLLDVLRLWAEVSVVSSREPQKN